MAVNVLPGLEVVADEHRFEAGFLGVRGIVEQPGGRELFGGRLVSELEHGDAFLGEFREVRRLLMDGEEAHNRRLIAVVMGMVGSGKTMVAARLAQRLGCAFQEGDALHPPENVARM